jgi:hypothetical protein
MTTETATADTNQTTLRFIEEEEWGTVPSSGDMQELRFTGESLGIERATTVSEEIRSDRQISDLIPTKVEAAGDINIEMSYGSYDEFIRSALCNDWGTAIDEPLPASAAEDSGELMMDTSDVPAVIKGMAFEMSGASNAENNRIFIITDIVETGLTTSITVSPALKTDAFSGEVRIKGTPIVNGVDTTSFYMEKEFLDVDKIVSYAGMVVDTMSLSVEAESKITGSFNFMGKSGNTETATKNPGNVLASTSTDIISSGTQDGTILEGATEIALIKSLTLEAGNNLRGKTAVGVVGNIGVGKGRFNVTGSLSAYFDDYRIYDKYLKNSSTSLVFSLSDPKAGTYVFNLPHIKFTESSLVAGSPDEDVMVDGGYQALMDPRSRKTLIITKISA